MQDYSIAKSTRKCSKSGRALEPGEAYVSAIVPDGESVKRVDIAVAEWEEPDAETIGWWRCKMPDAKAVKLRPAPNGVLLDTLSELLDCPGKESLSYMLALLLVRRRVLIEDEKLSIDSDEADDAFWKLSCSADKRQWNVPLIDPTAETVLALQDELNDLLFTEE